MVTKRTSPKYFKFDTLRYNRDEFRSQMHRKDPAPFSPRWLSGYALIQPKRSKKLVQAPKATELKVATKRSYPNRSTTHSSVYLNHKIHHPSRPKTAPDNPYRVWDSSKVITYKFHKRQFPKSRNPGDSSIGPLKTGKKQIIRPKQVYPDIPRWSNLRMFPSKKEATFNKPGSCFQDRYRHKKLIPQKTSINQFISPKGATKPIPNLSAFPRQHIKNVWKQHTSINSFKRPQTSSSTHTTLIATVLTHSC